MTIDKFGRGLKSKQGEQGDAIKGPKGDGFNLTPEGNYDLQNKSICNLGAPSRDNDATTKAFVENLTLKRTSYNDFDAGGKRIRNTIKPEQDGDVVNLDYFNAMTPFKMDYSRSYSFFGYTIKDIGAPKRNEDAVNLKHLKDNTIYKVKGVFDCKNTVIQNVTTPLADGDAVNKTYVDNVIKEAVTAATAVSTKTDLLSEEVATLKATIRKLEAKTAENKQYVDSQLKKFGIALFKYIHKQHTGRSVELSEDYNLNWEVLFKDGLTLCFRGDDGALHC